MDRFDGLPDSLIVDIFNRVGDVKTLLRCSLVSKRFNSLVPQTDTVLLRLDTSETETEPLLIAFFKSLMKSFHHFFLLFPKPVGPDRSCRGNNSPAHILSRFDRIQFLDIVLPGGDLRLEKGGIVRWKAEFGRTLKSCVILGFRSVSESCREYSGGDADADGEFARGLKTRVVWTISALVAASARHFLLKEVVKTHAEMEQLVLTDQKGEGTLVMDKEGLSEYREAARCKNAPEERVADRTVVPSVRMSMRHAPRLWLKSGCGAWAEGATLVVVRPSGQGKCGATSADMDDAELALSVFEGGSIEGEAVRALLNNRSHLVEMNSF